MKQTYCYGCMRAKTGSPFCEHCGYDERTAAAPHHLPPGTLLQGKYLVGRALGQGGFGITYLGRDTNLDIPVAIKEYYPTGMVMRECSHSFDVSVVTGGEDTRFAKNRSRFLREAQTLARLEDVPEVVQVKNFFVENNTAYIIMGYVKGITLKEYLRRRGGRLSVEETFQLLRPLLEAMGQVHGLGLVHRDISPDNIMLQPNGKVRLIDFGAAHAATRAGDKSTQAVLKHGFAPIEQYQSKGQLGAWTDVYAMCATIYCCLSGETPPNVTDRVTGEDDFRWERIPGLTAAQRDALTQGVALQYTQRIRSMEELCARLFAQSSEPQLPETGTIALVAPVEPPAQVYTAPVSGSSMTGSTNTAALLRRAFLFLEDGNWSSADEYCERVLDNDPENGQAYLGKLLAELRVTKQEALVSTDRPFSGSGNYQKALRFGDSALRRMLEEAAGQVNARAAQKRRAELYENGLRSMRQAKTEQEFREAGMLLRSADYRDSGVLAQQCFEKAAQSHKEQLYIAASSRMEADTASGYEDAIRDFRAISGWRDADKKLELCRSKLEKLRRMETNVKGYRKKRTGKRLALLAIAVVICIAAAALLFGGKSLPSGQTQANVLMGYAPEEATAFGTKALRTEVVSITFLNSTEDASALRSVDASAARDESVLAWTEKNGNRYDLFIAAEGGVRAPADCSSLFAGFTNLKTIQWKGAFDTSGVTTMDNMFGKCYQLEKLDLSGLRTGSVESMAGMFATCINLSELNLSGWDTAQVTDMSAMFEGCAALRQVDVSGFDTGNVRTMEKMFYGCGRLRALDVSGFQTGRVTDMYGMFCGCGGLQELDLSGFDTSRVENMSFMFYDTIALENVEGSFSTALIVNVESFMDPKDTFNGKPWEQLFD